MASVDVLQPESNKLLERRRSSDINHINRIREANAKRKFVSIYAPYILDDSIKLKSVKNLGESSSKTATRVKRSRVPYSVDNFASASADRKIEIKKSVNNKTSPKKNIFRKPIASSPSLNILESRLKENLSKKKSEGRTKNARKLPIKDVLQPGSNKLLEKRRISEINHINRIREASAKRQFVSIYADLEEDGVKSKSAENLGATASKSATREKRSRIPYHSIENFGSAIADGKIEIKKTVSNKTSSKKSIFRKPIASSPSLNIKESRLKENLAKEGSEWFLKHPTKISKKSASKNHKVKTNKRLKTLRNKRNVSKVKRDQIARKKPNENKYSENHPLDSGENSKDSACDMAAHNTKLNKTKKTRKVPKKYVLQPKINKLFERRRSSVINHIYRIREAIAKRQFVSIYADLEENGVKSKSAENLGESSSKSATRENRSRVPYNSVENFGSASADRKIENKKSVNNKTSQKKCIFRKPIASSPSLNTRESRLKQNLAKEEVSEGSLEHPTKISPKSASKNHKVKTNLKPETLKNKKRKVSKVVKEQNLTKNLNENEYLENNFSDSDEDSRNSAYNKISYAANWKTPVTAKDSIVLKWLHKMKCLETSESDANEESTNSVNVIKSTQ